MPRTKAEAERVVSPVKPAITPEAEESQMIALATNLARERLLNGTASAQEVIHYLRLGSSTARAENEKLKKEIELLNAKTEALESAKRVEELYGRALSAMRTYKGEDEDEDIQ